MPDWSLWPTITVAGLAVLGIAFAAGLWAGAVSADREPFKNFMIEIKEKLGIILDRLPPPRIISSSNPVQLSKFGIKISENRAVKAWAESRASDLLDRVMGKQPFEIFEECKIFVETKFDEDEKLQLEVLKGAYEHGTEIDQIKKVYQVELRDQLLLRAGQSRSP